MAYHAADIPCESGWTLALKCLDVLLDHRLDGFSYSYACFRVNKNHTDDLIDAPGSQIPAEAGMKVALAHPSIRVKAPSKPVVSCLHGELLSSMSRSSCRDHSLMY